MLHVFKHSKFISHAMASRHPGETGKKPEPEQESKRACSQKTRITAHGAPPQKLKPEPFPSFPGRFYTASGAVIPHGITACTGPRGHTVYQIGNTCRKRTRGRGLRCHAGHAGSSALGLLSGGTKERRTTGREKKISAARASCSGTCPPTV